MRALILFTLFFAVAANAKETTLSEKQVGLYIHQHWPYNHPYCARTWTVEDWRGFADGIKRIGYNSLMIWPVIETMPEPLAASDVAALKKLQSVIQMLHRDYSMRVILALCPNVAANNEAATKAPFVKRHFFYCDVRVNPADPAAMEKMLNHREKLLRYLSEADAVSIIDSDPGGYAGSNNAEFIHLLGEHRKMLDRIRPGMELIYWMHAGWESYSRFYATGLFALGDEQEHMDALRRLIELNPEPWGIANGLEYARKLGIENRVIGLNYGYIEGEPSFPMTNYGGNQAYEGGSIPAPRGVMGNAQTHCVQLPNIFAFARGAQGKPVKEEDYVQFADQLIVGEGRAIVEGWKALSGADSGAMRSSANVLEAAAKGKLVSGMLKGLLFGSPKRFLTDMVMMLRMRAADLDFCFAVENGKPYKELLAIFVKDAEKWQRTHGYENSWWDGKLDDALRKLHNADFDRILGYWDGGEKPFEHIDGANPYERQHEGLRLIETSTPELLKALERASR